MPPILWQPPTLWTGQPIDPRGSDQSPRYNSRPAYHFHTSSFPITPFLPPQGIFSAFFFYYYLPSCGPTAHLSHRTPLLHLIPQSASVLYINSHTFWKFHYFLVQDKCPSVSYQQQFYFNAVSKKMVPTAQCSLSDLLFCFFLYFMQNRGNIFGSLKVQNQR